MTSTLPRDDERRTLPPPGVLRRRRRAVLTGAVSVAAALAVTAGLTIGGVFGGPTEPDVVPADPGRPTAPGTGGAPALVGGEATRFGLKPNWAVDRAEPVLTEFAGGWTFLETEWCDVEPSPGTFDWQQTDRQLATTQRFGYRTMLKIRVGSCWASEAPTEGTGDPVEGAAKTPSSPPVDLAAYQQYVRTFVARYSARGVTAYALENEIDTFNFWAADPGRYAEVARAGAAAVAEADPDAVVYDAGLSSVAYGVVVADRLLGEGKDGEALRFYQASYERRQAAGVSLFPAVTDLAGLREVLGSERGRRVLAAYEAVLATHRDGAASAYQLHYYERGDLLAQVLDVLERDLPAGTPIAAWELGTAWPGATYDPWRHARETDTMVGELLERGAGPIVYLPVKWSGGAASRGQEVWRGLLAPDGTERPALDVLRGYVAEDRAGT